jgi:UDP-N-acetyl-D-galactosamine dehydrogenase
VLDAAETKWNFHRYEPGLGVGGHCIAVDPYYFIYAARRAGHDLSLISSARRVNEGMPDYYTDQILGALAGRDGGLADSAVCVLGITYKPGVKDLRNSQALAVADALEAADIRVTVYDPLYSDADTGGAVGYDLATDARSAATGADCLLLGTAHEEFRTLDMAAIADAATANPLFIDPYRFYEPQALRDAGFELALTGEISAQEAPVSHE